MTLTHGQAAVLARLADALIPAAGSMPSASGAGLCDGMIERVLRYRPDIAATLPGILEEAAGHCAKTFLLRLERDDSGRFDILFEAVAGAYYMIPAVRERIGYHGQRALDLPRAGIGAEDQLVEMMAAPSRYRRVAGD